jgi:Asp-tRNA(Asn)/Glu-tRNA(Gln) amidotransferase A subunit family amidase
MTTQSLIAALRTGDENLPDYLDRLEARFNEWEPRVLAFVPEEGRFARLRREARRLLDRYPDGASRPPLFGLPIGVKDIFHVNGSVTRAGSRLPAELLQGSEAECVSILRRAGALLLGKTVTTEFAYFAPGPTRNPRHLEHTPGGSSSGSAAAVAAGLCPFAFGTQTIGSISRPAAFCGVVGFKPSHGRVSARGVIPLSETHDHVGFFTNDVAGAETMAAHLCENWRESASEDRRPVLGIPNGPYLEQASPEGLAHFRKDCRRLADAGFTLKHIDALPDFEEIRRRHLLLVAAEAARFHATWFDSYESLYHPKTAELIRSGRTCSEEDITKARAYRLSMRKNLTDLMGAHDIDVWISPSARGPAPRGLESTGDPIMNLPWTHAGLPTLTIPTGTDNAGLPMALQLVGRWLEDEGLFQYGKAIEAIRQ